jgi:PTS system mannose-specific IID component
MRGALRMSDEMTKIQPERESAGDHRILTDQDIRKCAWRWCMSVNGFNYETQLAPSVVFAEADALRKIYSDDDEAYRKSIENSARYFNVTPPVAGILLGAGLAMEEKNGTSSLEAVQDLKVGLMGSLSGIGDAIIWVLIPTICGSISAYMAQNGNPVGALLYVAVMLVCSLGLKIKSWDWGYQFGTQLITSLADKVAALTEAMSVLGLTVVGALIPSVVKLSTSVSITIGDVSLGLQEGLFDKILVGLLPVCATVIVYQLLKKGVSTNKIILGIIVFCWLGAAFGFIG